MTNPDHLPKIIQMLPATAWWATFSDKESRRVIAWALCEDGRLVGVCPGGDCGLVAADGLPDFAGYVYQTQKQQAQSLVQTQPVKVKPVKPDPAHFIKQWLRQDPKPLNSLVKFLMTEFGFSHATAYRWPENQPWMTKEGRLVRLKDGEVT